MPRRDTAGRRRDFDLLVVGEVNPDIVVVGDRPAAGVRPGRAVSSTPSASRSGASSAITACGAARLGPPGRDGRRRRRRRVRPVHARGAGRARHRRRGLPGRRGAADRRPRHPLGRARPGHPDRHRDDPVAAGRRRAARPARPARATSTSAASSSRRRSRPDLAGLFRAGAAGGATTSARPQLGSVAALGRRDRGRCLAETDVFLPNAAEATRITGLDGPEARPPRARSWRRSAPRVVAVKLGRRRGARGGRRTESSSACRPCR